MQTETENDGRKEDTVTNGKEISRSFAVTVLQNTQVNQIGY